ncbi:hypothetical protein NJB1507_37750 [Mycobacterium marinum]|uniref:hypothetical protein n=1 Tax=Mycobacterium marinum TaxID=1781 RepID=UPI0021C2C7BA|nr:hypothetical protein [Mycobacterium marinum]GJO30006.1 hypothetical protein NJB1507_37750 [Mycobacterium marinum]
MTRTRSRRSAKTAGTRFEASIANALATALDDDRIERRAKSGAKDRGDISGLRSYGRRIVAEAKDYGGRFLIGEWLTEAEIERGNDDASAAVVIAKRRGHGNPLDQAVICTLRDLIVLLGGERCDS